MTRLWKNRLRVPEKIHSFYRTKTYKNATQIEFHAEKNAPLIRGPFIKIGIL